MVDSGISNHQEFERELNDQIWPISITSNFDPNPLLIWLGQWNPLSGYRRKGRSSHGPNQICWDEMVLARRPVIPIKSAGWWEKRKMDKVFWKKPCVHILKKASSGDIVNLSIWILFTDWQITAMQTRIQLKNIRGNLKTNTQNLANKGVSVVMASGNVHDDSEYCFFSRAVWL